MSNQTYPIAETAPRILQVIAAFFFNTLVTLLALLLTFAELAFSCAAFLLIQSGYLLLKLIFILLLASLFILAYMIGVGIIMLLGPGISSNLP